MADITKINLNGTALTIVDSAATSAIAGEIARAQGAESAITTALSAEVVARESADTALQTAINAKADSATTYTKTEVDNALAAKANTATTYTKTEVDNAITAATSGLQETLSAGTGIDITNNVISCTVDTGLYVVVTELPAQPAAGNENKIHLVPLASGSTGQNDYYEEYLWKGDAWEYLGTRSVEIDLSDYYTSAQTNSAIASALTDYYTSAQTNSAITNATSGKVDTSAYTAYTASTDSALTAMSASISANTSAITAHTGNTNNPHQVTAAQLGISASYSAETETLILVIPSSASPAPVSNPTYYVEDSNGGIYNLENGSVEETELTYDTDWSFTLYSVNNGVSAVVTANTFSMAIFGDEESSFVESNYAVTGVGYGNCACMCRDDSPISFLLEVSNGNVSVTITLGCTECE